MLEADLLGSEFIGTADNLSDLAKCLTLCIKDSPKRSFACYEIIPNLDQSVRVFGQKPFKRSVQLPDQMSPLEIAHTLMEAIRINEVRYPMSGDICGNKGWTIHKATDHDGNILVAVYATWL